MSACRLPLPLPWSRPHPFGAACLALIISGGCSAGPEAGSIDDLGEGVQRETIAAPVENAAPAAPPPSSAAAPIDPTSPLPVATAPAAAAVTATATPTPALLTPAALAAKVPLLRIAKESVAKGKSPGATLTATRRVTPGPAGQPTKITLREVVGPGDTAPPNAITDAPTPAEGSDFWFTLGAGQDGALTLTDSIDFKDRVWTEFSPPMLVLPADLKVGATSTSTFEMTVHPLSDLKKVKAQGQATSVVVVEALERVTVPAGTFEALRIRSTLTASLGPAKVSNVTTTWYAAGKGIVLTRESQKVTALGLPVRNSTITWVTTDLRDAP
ncbi:hypothetical protein BH11PLA1_BH11PLA1_23100 [soil metagenome]